MMKIVLALALGSATAFRPATVARRSFALRSEAEAAVVEEAPVAEPPAPAYPTVNGWTADESKFCWGLPGALAPMGDFDPLGLAPEDLTEMKRFREAEVTHGRVAMTAVLGFLVAESFHPLFGGNIGGPAIF